MKEREREKIDVLAINNVKVDRDKCMEIRVTFWLWFEENVKPKKNYSFEKKQHGNIRLYYKDNERTKR